MILLPRHPLWQLLCLRQDVSHPFSPYGPHSHHCPFKKEEILLINKRPNLSAKPGRRTRWVPGKSVLLSGTESAPSST